MRSDPAALVRHDARRAGDVMRYHTWPVVQQQTGAHHTWNVCRILVTIWPDAPADAIRYALFHDAGELGPGDVPFPYKMQSPSLKHAFDQMEEQSLRNQGITLPVLTDEWRWRIKTADLIEMLEKGLDEFLMGNTYGIPIVTQITGVLEERMAIMASSSLYPDRQAVSVYLTRRLDLFFAASRLQERVLDRRTYTRINQP